MLTPYVKILFSPLKNASEISGLKTDFKWFKIKFKAFPQYLYKKKIV